MLFLTFQLGPDLHALDVALIVEVLPLVELKPSPHAPPGVAGLFNWRGRPLIALDVCAMALGRPSAKRMSTRIVLVRLAAGRVRERLLGLIVERASGVIKLSERDFVETGYQSSAARYLGPVATVDDGRLLQRIEPRELITPEVLDALYARVGEDVDA
jgi:chemotaxis-related protein WspB